MASNVGIQKIQKNEFGKIPLPWHSEEAEATRNKTWENTHAYWLISQSWNGLDSAQKGSGTTVGDALHDCNEILESCYTGHKLFSVTSDLRDDIILYGTKRQKRREKKLIATELAKAIIL